MVSKEVKIAFEGGLHARTASVLVTAAKEYESTVDLTVYGRRINAKSIMMILSAGISENDPVTVTADGPDEQEAVDELVRILEDSSLK